MSQKGGGSFFTTFSLTLPLKEWDLDLPQYMLSSIQEIEMIL